MINVIYFFVEDVKHTDEKRKNINLSIQRSQYKYYIFGIYPFKHFLTNQCVSLTNTDCSSCSRHALF